MPGSVLLKQLAYDAIKLSPLHYITLQ